MTTPINQLLSLAGTTWKGQGAVLNAAGDTVATYTEEATFQPVRKTDSFIVFRHLQETQHAVVANKPMHTETGFLKFSLTDGTAVGSFAHPFPSGFIQEMSQGAWQALDDDALQITLQANSFQRAVPSTAAANTDKKQVHGFKRVYTLEGGGDALSYKQYLSTTEGGDNLYHHLTCSFSRKVN